MMSCDKCGKAIKIDGPYGVVSWFFTTGSSLSWSGKLDLCSDCFEEFQRLENEFLDFEKVKK